MPVLKPGPDGGLGIDGNGSPAGGAFLGISFSYNASSVDSANFVAQRDYIVKSITGRVTVAGTDGGAVTAQVRKAASGTAITSGTVLHSGTFNLKGTANTNQSLTVTAADAYIPAGTALCIDYTGTLTSATGVISVQMVPA